MDFGAAIGFPFRGEKAWKNIALAAVCHLIPIVGPIAVMGYGTYVERALVRDPRGAAPEFDFGRLGKYLERGVAPFVITLVLTVVAVLVSWAVMFGGLLLAAAGGGRSAALAIAGFAVAFGGMLVVMIALMLLMLPFLLRATLAGRIGEAFNFGWAIDFLKRTFGALIVSALVLAGIGLAAGLVGLLACYFGIFLTMMMYTLISWHVQVQLYHLYLDRGGVPVPILEDDIAPAFPVMSPAPRQP